MTAVLRGFTLTKKLKLSYPSFLYVLQDKSRLVSIRKLIKLADYLNINQVDFIIIQHEFGIFGGSSGNYILECARNLRMPIVNIFHTVLREPNNEQKKIIKELISLSDKSIVMSNIGKQFLIEGYHVPENKITMIPHGIPDKPFIDPVFFKELFGLEGKFVLLTFGLLSPGKGIENVIKALPKIVEKHPELLTDEFKETFGIKK